MASGNILFTVTVQGVPLTFKLTDDMPVGEKIVVTSFVLKTAQITRPDQQIEFIISNFPDGTTKKTDQEYLIKFLESLEMGKTLPSLFLDMLERKVSKYLPAATIRRIWENKLSKDCRILSSAAQGAGHNKNIITDLIYDTMTENSNRQEQETYELKRLIVHLSNKIDDMKNEINDFKTTDCQCNNVKRKCVKDEETEDESKAKRICNT